MTDSVKVVAVREYGAVMSNGIVVKLTFAMCDFGEDDSIPARFARQHRAETFGLITIDGVAGVPSKPIVWLLRGDHVAITVSRGEPDLTPELREVIQRHMQEYFRDIADLAPEFEGFGSKPRTLN